MSCIVRAQRRVCKRRVTLGHGLEWAHKIQTETQIDLIETRIRNGLVRRGRSLPSIFAAWLRPTCHLGDFRTFMYKMMHPPPSETTRCYATWVLVRVGTLKLTTLACLLLTKNNLATVLSENNWSTCWKVLMWGPNLACSRYAYQLQGVSKVNGCSTETVHIWPHLLVKPKCVWESYIFYWK